MRHSLPVHFTAVIAGALLFAACGDEGASQAKAPPEVTLREKHPIEFVEGFAAGREAAGDDDALIFVYVGRHHPT